MKSTPLPSTFRWIATLALAVGLSSSLFAAKPVVSNVNGVQRAGTKLVDIAYDVTADTPTVTVSLRISSDGGATFSVPVTTLSGAVGADVAVGAGKVITWNAGTDWLGNYSSTMRFEVTAEDGVDPVPADMALIPAGSFTMGDSLDGLSDAPPVTVSVGAFYMGKYEVTKDVWDEVRTWGLANGYTDLAAGAGKATNHPVQSISWFDMVKWCNARSEKEGLTPVYTLSSAVMKTGTTDPVANWTANGYRLPTAAEWEKAARGGVSGKRFPWGTDTISHSRANYYASSSYSYDSSGSVNNFHPTYATGSYPYTSPVGAFAANGYGLYDMAGNVWEWCWDWYGGTYANGATDPRGAASGTSRVGRGGSWNFSANYCRVASRDNGSYPTGSGYDVGFRVARSSVPEEFVLVEAGALPADSWAGAQSVEAFFMGKTEVTWAEFQAVRTWAAANGYDIGNVGAVTGPNHPVNSVGWYQALKWCNARSEKEGLNPVYKVGSAVYRTGDSVPSIDGTANGYRLPSEKEWEFAARGGVKTNGYEYSGSNDINEVAWYSSNSGDGTKDVATKQANELGLSDMIGNVWEWCFDDWDGSGSYRVVRGGSWHYYASDCRVADRHYSSPTVSYNYVGFRVARSYQQPMISVSTDSLVNTRSWALTESTPSNGSITGQGDYDNGVSATLTATPNPGYRFTGWTGDASGTANPLTITMDADKTVGASFEPDLSDADSDGLSAYDELLLHGTDPALADTDGDGLSDALELGIGRFSIVSGSFTWQQARTDARSKGGDLASFPTESLWNRALQNLGANPFDEFTGLWIGASDAAVEGTWTWVNGEALSFAPWGSTRPSSTVGNSLDFAEISGGGGAEIGKWYDRSATAVRDGYLLETGYATDPTVADADGDGLNDGQEQTAGSHPAIADTDGDGLSDGQEVNLTRTNPTLADTDGDGSNDAASDEDGDSLGNLAEISMHGTDPLKTDTDGDGLSDSAELSHPASFFALIEGSFTHAQATADASARGGRIASFPNANDFVRMASKARKTSQGYLWLGLSDAAAEGAWTWTDGSSPTYTRWLNGQPDGATAENHVVLMENSSQWADAAAEFIAAGYLFERVGLDPLVADTDGDGLNDGAEISTHQTSPVLDDSDGDGLSDGAEITTHGSNPNLDDSDADGLSDFAEVVTHGTNPSVKDSDSDGFDDLFEINTGFDPTLDSSTPDALSSIRTAVEFRFNAGNGISYRIESSTDLETWTIAETDIIGAGGVVTRFYSTENQPKRYFRVRRN